MPKQMKNRIAQRLGFVYGTLIIIHSISWMADERYTRLDGIRWATRDVFDLTVAFYAIGIVGLISGIVMVISSFVMAYSQSQKRRKRAEWTGFLISFLWPYTLAGIFIIAWITQEAPYGHSSALMYVALGSAVLVTQTTSAPGMYTSKKLGDRKG